MDTCLLYSPLVTFAVALLKRIPFVGHNPKVVAMVCAAVLGIAHAYYATGAMPAVADLVRCTLETLSGAVLTHEAVVKPITGALSDTSAV